MRADSSQDLPRRYGKYELLERIGSGGMAEVYRARLPGIAGFEKTVVIKRLHSHYADRQEFVQLFVEEAKLAAEVQHKNVVNVFDLGSLDDGEVFMAMEYVAGTDLKNLLRRSNQNGLRVPPWLATHFVCEVLEALAYAHELTDRHGRPRNIVHCDVTPENVFLSHLGEVKLGDFGVAQDDSRGKDPFEGQLKGKVPYMSPEQVQGHRPDQRSDVFAAGIVLWECLTQRRLFSAPSQRETMRKLVYAPRIPPSHFSSDVPPELDALVLGALEANPDHRIPTARAMQSRLLDILEDLHPRRTMSEIRAALAALVPPPAPPAEDDFEVDLDEDDEGEVIELSESSILSGIGSTPVASALAQPSGLRDPSPGLGAPAIVTSSGSAPGSGPGSGAFSRPGDIRASVPPEVEEDPVTERSEVPVEAALPPVPPPADAGRAMQAAYEAWLEMGGDPEAPPPRMPPRRPSPGRTLPSRDDSFTYGIVHPKNAVDRLGSSSQLPRAPIPSPASGMETQDILRSQPRRDPVAPRSSPRATLLPGAPVPAEPPPRVESSAGRHPMWVRTPDGSTVGPRGPAEALELMGSLIDGAAPADVAISADGRRWIDGHRLGPLLGEEIVPADGAAPRGAPSGDLARTSLVSIFGQLARASTTGRLAVIRTSPHGATRWELALDAGRLLGLGSSASHFEVWSRALDGAERRNSLEACLYRVVAEGMPVTALANPADREALRPLQVSAMQGHLHELFATDHGAFGMVDNPRPASLIGRPIGLLRLLPAVVSRARRTADLQRALGPQMHVALVRSDRFSADARLLDLSEADAERLAPFGHGYTLAQSLESCRSRRDEKLALVLAYLLIELGMLTPYYSHHR